MVEHQLYVALIKAAQSDWTVLLTIVIAIDIATGYAKSYVWKVTDSAVGVKGLLKHLTTLLVYVFAYGLAIDFDMSTLGVTLVVYSLLNYALSIVENLGVMGVITPKFLQAKIRDEIERYESKLDKGGK